MELQQVIVKEKDIECSKCKIVQPKSKNFYKHSRICKKCTIAKNLVLREDGEKYHCNDCNYSTISLVMFSTHLKSKKHLLNISKGLISHNCDICKYSTRDLKELLNHITSTMHLSKMRELDV